jgi:hypothetical protein
LSIISILRVVGFVGVYGYSDCQFGVVAGTEGNVTPITTQTQLASRVSTSVCVRAGQVFVQEDSVFVGIQALAEGDRRVGSVTKGVQLYSRRHALGSTPT